MKRRRLGALLCLVALMAAAASVQASGRAVRIGLVNPQVLAPAVIEGFGSDGQAVVKAYPSHESLREAYAKGEVDALVDFQTSVILLPAATLDKAAVYGVLAASYGDVGIVSFDPTVSSVADLGGASVGVEAGSAAEYFLTWVLTLLETERGRREPAIVHRSPGELTRLVEQGKLRAVVAEEPYLTRYAGLPGARVISSTASYHPVLHYLLVAPAKASSSTQRVLGRLLDLYLRGTRQAGADRAEYLTKVAATFRRTPEEAYAFSKQVYFDRPAALGYGMRDQDSLDTLLAGPISTWLEREYLDRSGVRLTLEPSLWRAASVDGRMAYPSPRPWSGEAIEIMRRVRPIQFELNKAELTPDGRATLDGLAAEIRQNCLDYTIEVQGYTDNLGTQVHNQLLSEARARTVALYLAQRLDLPPAAVKWKGMGVGGAGAENRKTVIRVLQRLVPKS